MAAKRILIQWIGHSDLRALAAASPASWAKKILAEIQSKPSEAGDLVPQLAFDLSPTAASRHFILKKPLPRSPMLPI